ncbi:MAG: hypothetical protein DDG60_05880 [Anaerolineae bacterium]|nr:MAG: hypothetical protein DDG60_05880 [Anaerolineae bacterium]
MSKILDVKKRHASVLPRARRGEEHFVFSIPEGEVFHSSRLTVLEAVPGAKAQIVSQPAPNASGQGQISVQWQHPGAAGIGYQVEAFSVAPGGGVNQPSPSAVWTGFMPARHGFRFVNAFPPYPHIQLLTPFGRIRIGDAKNGLCGGMVFAALDFFYAGQPIPEVVQPPAGDMLFEYIVKRLYDSFNLPFGIGGYIEMMRPALPDHAPGLGGLFSRAWRTVRQEWPVIKALLDAGQPCPLGLVRVKSTDLRRLGENHQVLAYGYDVEDGLLTLFIYDPNYGQTERVRMLLDLTDPEGPTRMVYSTGEPLYAFFHVRYRYHPLPGEGTALGRILLFEKPNFGGRAKDISFGSPNLALSEDGFFDNRVSSFIIVSGHWMFYKHSGFRAPYMRGDQPLVLGPGQYAHLEALGIPEDDISSLRAVNLPVNG